MMIPDTFCGACGEAIFDEQSNGESSPKRPCPGCGSLARRFELEVKATIAATATVELSVKTYPQVLLSTADDLLNREQFGISIVVAHMACEVAAERVLSESFRVKQVDYLEEAVLGFLNGYNLASDKNRRLYLALTGDDIQRQPFWQAFKESAIRRNAVIHKGRIISHSEASDSLTAAKAFVAHLSR